MGGTDKIVALLNKVGTNAYSLMSNLVRMMFGAKDYKSAPFPTQKPSHQQRPHRVGSHPRLPSMTEHSNFTKEREHVLTTWIRLRQTSLCGLLSSGKANLGQSIGTGSRKAGKNCQIGANGSTC